MRGPVGHLQLNRRVPNEGPKIDISFKVISGHPILGVGVGVREVGKPRQKNVENREYVSV